MAGDRRLSAGAGCLLLHALTERGVDTPRGVVYGEHGKPRIPDVPGFEFNLSHSGDFAMCAVSDVPVGCDIEKIKEARFSVAKRYFTDEETEYFSSSRDGARAFYEIWTRKESYLKATGDGLSGGAAGISVPKTGICINGWTVSTVPAPEGYAAAFCTAGKDAEFEISFVVIESII